jgi:hypothetical protein
MKKDFYKIIKYPATAYGQVILYNEQIWSLMSILFSIVGIINHD